MKHTLYTYAGINELRRIQDGNVVIPYLLEDTIEALEDTPNIFVDITSLVYYIMNHSGKWYDALDELGRIPEDTIVIVEGSAIANALTLFSLVFSDGTPYFEKAEEDVPHEKEIFSPLRKPLFTYDNSSALSKIIEFSKEHSIPIATFSQASGVAKNDFDSFNKSKDLALLDLTSVSFAIENNKNLIYLVELLLDSYPNIQIISQTNSVDSLLDFFPLYIEGQKNITELLPDLDLNEEVHIQEKEIRITDLNNDELNAFFSGFEHNLIGHSNFKNRFKHEVKHFIALNKVKEQKVLSVFLYGPSGIGKTEVARLIANGLHEDGYLAKISFQNYSSQDALNSLIGSPAGYIGCEHGELSDKIAKTKIGVLLCDEFEKTTRPVFLFFLELLEEGYFTDSMAREYDLDGFIIVFTSNLQTENDYKKTIPPELQTRFDLVCEFEPPTLDDKKEFLQLLLEKAKQKHKDAFSKFAMQDEDQKFLMGFDCSQISALRDIKRLFNNRLMDLFESKGL